MALFQTKKIQSFIVFIIVLAAILWVFQDNFLKLLVFQKVSEQSKQSLSQLSDTELILKAIDSGNFTKIEFGGSDGGNPDVPSYAKVLANRKELIGVLLESLWESKSYNIVDTLSVYLHISEDIQKDPNKKSFFYQIVDKKGVNEREFIIDGFETIIIDNNEVETIRVISPKLRLVFNISKGHNFIPIYINKTNGEANFELVLTDYTQ